MVLLIIERTVALVLEQLPYQLRQSPVFNRLCGFARRLLTRFAARFLQPF
jgi:hypothetical protein